MSYKHVGNAADLVRFGCSLKVECTKCGAARTMSSIEAYQALGNREFSQLERRFKCKRCSKKAARLVVLGPVYPD